MRTATRACVRGAAPRGKIAAREFVVSWNVLTAVAAGPGKAARAEGALEVRLSVGAGGQAVLACVLRRGGSEHSVRPARRCSASVVEDGDLIHVRAVAARSGRGGPLLDATLRGARVLYARSCLLAGLGLGGGRYEAVRDPA